MVAFISIPLQDVSWCVLAASGLCFTEQYNARVFLGVVPEAYLLADHANTGCYQLLMHGDYRGFVWRTTFVTEKECKLPACMQITMSA